MEPRVQHFDGGTVIFDPARVGDAPNPSWFDPLFWAAGGRVLDRPQGRGAALLVQAPFGRALLRHYRRGGLVARLFHDRYLWSGTENTRAFREFRLLAKATDRGLPVPAPLAARIERTAGWYRADILLDAIDGAVTLAARAARERAQVPWAAIGQAIGAIHRAGIWHADLNAHNVLIGPEEKVWIVDFDRASERPLDASWCAGNLERLHRSLTKLGIVYARADFNRDEWPALVLAHAQMLPAVVPGERDVALKSASS